MKFLHNFLLFIIIIAFSVTVITLITVSSSAAKQNEVNLTKTGGVYEVPVILNDSLTISLILDSGAADVSISPDVALTLYKTKTITDDDWLPGAYYQFADGSSAKSYRFKLKSLRIGNENLTNVPCSISNSIHAPMLLGQSALQKLGKYSIDTEKMMLIFGDPDAVDYENIKINKVHPDYKKYWEDGSLQAWIREQPASVRKEMQRVYDKGNAKEIINLLSRFKQFQNSPEGLLIKANDGHISLIAAIEFLTEAIDKKPDYADAYERRGDAYTQMSEYQRAVEDYSKSISLKPTGELYKKRADAYNNLGRHQLAVEDYTLLISLEPDNFYEYYKMRGEAYIELGGFQNALDDFNRCFSMKPRTAAFDHELYFDRGRTYAKIEQYERAIEDYNKSIGLEPTATAYRNRGIVYLNMGKRQGQGCDDVREACHMGQCKTLDELLKKKICPCEKEDWINGRSTCKMD